MNDIIRIVVVEDHPLVRHGIRDLLQTEPDMEVVGEAGDGKTAVALAEKLKPHLMIMDLVMPEMDGIEATRRIKETQPSLQILVLTSFATDDKVFPAIKAGALGYLIKDTEPRALIQAVRQVHAGQVTLDPSVAQKLLKEIAGPHEQPPAQEQLTEREVDVLKLLAKGMSNQEIAASLVISITTVYTHVSNILAKLHLATRTQAALYALREGYASLYDDS